MHFLHPRFPLGWPVDQQKEQSSKLNWQCLWDFFLKPGIQKMYNCSCNKTRHAFFLGGSHKRIWCDEVLFFTAFLPKIWINSKQEFQRRGSWTWDFTRLPWALLGRAWDTHKVIFVSAKKNLISSRKMPRNCMFTNSTNSISVPSCIVRYWIQTRDSWTTSLVSLHIFIRILEHERPEHFVHGWQASESDYHRAWQPEHQHQHHTGRLGCPIVQFYQTCWIGGCVKC